MFAHDLEQVNFNFPNEGQGYMGHLAGKGAKLSYQCHLLLNFRNCNQYPSLGRPGFKTRIGYT
eukprot:1741707-Amphidinium_carterae.1